jgi:hypothetical protein
MVYTIAMNEIAVIDGWCRVGSKVVTDFYIDEADYIRHVTRIHIWPDTNPVEASVWVDGGVSSDGRKGRPMRLDYRTWVRKPKLS